MEEQKTICGFIYTVKKEKKTCNFKLTDGSNWCGKHQRGGRVFEDTAKEIRHCSNWRRCPNSLLPEGYTYPKCQSCLTIASESENNLNDRFRKQQEIELANANDGDAVICRKCHKRRLIKGVLTKHGKQSTKCKTCYLAQEKAENKRSDYEIIDDDEPIIKRQRQDDEN